MDPRIAFAVVALMMLLNGGVLGLMHRDLPHDVRPSAVDWRRGTLLVAGATVLFMVQRELPLAFILPVANGCSFAGAALYWRAMRRFDGLPEAPWLFAPVIAGTLAIYWFAAITPDLTARILVSTLVWLVMTFGVVWTLRHRDGAGAFSRRVLRAMFIGVGLFLLWRGAFVALHPPAVETTVDMGSILNVVSPIVTSIIPVIGTTAFLLMCSDRLRRRAENAAATDYLTGLPNRRTIMAGGQSRLAAARRSAAPLAVALIDIDHFKRINDTCGHEAGDRALRHVADLLAANCRGQLLGRHGGEEFVALLENADATGAKIAGERLRAAVAQQPLVIEGVALPLTVSVGLSVLTDSDRSFDDLLRRADMALYTAKESGRNRVEMEQPRVD